MMGCEVAEFLVKRGRQVTVVEESGEMGIGLPEQVHRQRLLAWLEAKGVNMLTGVKYGKITDKGLVISKDGKRRTIKTDTILLALSPRENTALFKSLEGKALEIHLIGDASKFDLMMGAIHDGARIGRLI
jgi:pyruvate/2-oxoglutarate dehydrogenase complex dihydrolipoamide dehydrogenase (E3) component